MSTELPYMPVVAGMILREGKVLIARRQGGHMHGYWEFPGGKVESGELPAQSLKRELKEELGVDVEVGDFVGKSEHEIPGKRIRLLAYQVFLNSTEFVLSAHSEIRWVGPDSWDKYQLAPADLPLLSDLRKLMREQ